MKKTTAASRLSLLDCEEDLQSDLQDRLYHEDAPRLRQPPKAAEKGLSQRRALQEAREADFRLGNDRGRVYSLAKGKRPIPRQRKTLQGRSRRLGFFRTARPMGLYQIACRATTIPYQITLISCQGNPEYRPMRSFTYMDAVAVRITAPEASMR